MFPWGPSFTFLFLKCKKGNWHAFPSSYHCHFCKNAHLSLTDLLPVLLHHLDNLRYRELASSFLFDLLQEGKASVVVLTFALPYLHWKSSPLHFLIYNLFPKPTAQSFPTAKNFTFYFVIHQTNVTYLNKVFADFLASMFLWQQKEIFFTSFSPEMIDSLNLMMVFL